LFLIEVNDEYIGVTVLFRDSFFKISYFFKMNILNAKKKKECLLVAVQ